MSSHLIGEEREMFVIYSPWLFFPVQEAATEAAQGKKNIKKRQRWKNKKARCCCIVFLRADSRCSEPMSGLSLLSHNSIKFLVLTLHTLTESYIIGFKPKQIVVLCFDEQNHDVLNRCLCCHFLLITELNFIYFILFLYLFVFTFQPVAKSRLLNGPNGAGNFIVF